MGWIAVGAGTVVAAYAFYVLVTRCTNDNDSRATIKTVQIDQRHNTRDRNEDKPTSINGAVPAQPTITAPNQPTGPSISIAEPAVEDQMPPPRTTPQPPSGPRLNSPTMGSMPPPPPPPRRVQPPLRSASPPRLKPPSMAPPPRPAGPSLRPPPSAASSLRVPQTKVLSNTHMQPASSTLPLPPGSSKKKSRAIALEPGYSPLDWAALTSSPNSNLRGKDAPPNGRLIRVTPSQLKKQNGRKGKDAWTIYQGKVYNVTPYLPFHPGGKAELMRGAGRDAGQLFMEVHPWVNWDGMLGECLVGILVAEGEGDNDQAEAANELDEMD
ncbi:uncharacterized protein HMPREF1541_06555 [Cyphellophora europaea CBS 101466]|uniref:Cytochrome b5 heme-binding domain-containing protein n=1 Tax=Cyphellophora europaea (strain CBS 101466) TaxID=1220924 RepID=W2RQD0_CYPE1|nr:uncharacterized protein HMPREF1541_06555 [Cyphellophora europaea CBS 101466]ETN38520.1 hypothetical protein HMPREF1541_06555 [Cyphellophora europaea CBS 101466]